MNGPELREHLINWGISRRMLADAVVLDGYYIEPNNVAAWKDNVPPIVVRQIERWRDNPGERPAKPRAHTTR